MLCQNSGHKEQALWQKTNFWITTVFPKVAKHIGGHLGQSRCVLASFTLKGAMCNIISPLGVEDLYQNKLPVLEVTMFLLFNRHFFFVY